jgi:hypothetical protein
LPSALDFHHFLLERQNLLPEIPFDATEIQFRRFWESNKLPPFQVRRFAHLSLSPIRAEHLMTTPTPQLTVTLTMPWREIAPGESVRVGYEARLNLASGQEVCTVRGGVTTKIVRDSDGDVVVDMTPVTGHAWGQVNDWLLLAAVRRP